MMKKSTVMMIKRFVGIDPSSTTGFYIQDEKGNTMIEEDLFYQFKKDPERMIYITDSIINNLDLENDKICIEGFSYNSKGKGIDYQYGIGWIIREQLNRYNFKYYDVAPTALKKFATGKGNTKKESMVEPIKQRWNFYHPSDNITDAFVLSEIAKAIELGDSYKGLRNHEKEVVKIVKNGIMNKEEWIETTIPRWMNPRSKYYFKREK